MKKTANGKNTASIVEALIKDTVEKLGYILWDVEYKKEGPDYNLIVTIDNESGELDIEDCVKVNDAINPILDKEDPISDSYCLEVSSAGLERDLKRKEHFEKYKGKEVEIKLFRELEGFGKCFIATLDDFDGDSFTFSQGENVATAEKTNITYIRTVVNYEELLKKN